MRTDSVPDEVTVLETGRLSLRRLTEDDAEFILALVNDASFIRYIGDRGVRTLEDARAYVRNGPAASYDAFGFGLFLTALKTDGTPIGICGLLKREGLDDVDVGFAFLPRYCGQGYAVEAARAVMAYGRETWGLSRIVAVVQPDNAASIRLLEKLGMTFERMVTLSETGPELQLFG